MITILGKSEATITFIADNMAHRALEFGQKIVVVNNLEIPDRLEYKNYPFKWEEVEAVKEEALTDKTEVHKNFLLGVYNPKEKIKALALFKIDREQFINAIHNNTSISCSANLGRGLLINANATIAGFTKIGDFVSINRNVAIGHHVTVEDFVTINPSASIGGNCIIGEAATIGMGAIILDGVTIGKNCLIGAGAVVTKDVADNVKGFGVPFAEQK